MLDKLEAILDRFAELDRRLAEAGTDFQLVAELSKERSDLEPIVNLAREYKDNLAKTEETEELISVADGELLEMAHLELDELKSRLQELEAELKSMLIPKDPRDNRNVIIEIRAGTGGDEAGLFVSDLLRMYLKYADIHRYKTEIISASETGIGGYKDVTFSVKGRGAYSRFKFESGVHRVQRVPETESQGRIHTSTVTVAVLAEVEDFEIEIPDSDIEIDVFKSAGAGGQNVQKNMTAVRIHHKPTGLIVACQDERSQLQNRLRAMSVLKARLYEIEYEKRHSELDASRRSQIGTGERSEKIRTYNYPQSRVTDHRINVSSYNMAGVMDGYELDTFIEELQHAEEAERLANFETDD
ncbi:MAG TPA: peptide chain release factor 1 [Anaerolineaceae bacterium]|nr:peptide chain release factor 1 [Anaerolineaceae bacterium]